MPGSPAHDESMVQVNGGLVDQGTRYCVLRVLNAGHPVSKRGRDLTKTRATSYIELR